jgi:Ras-related protein Rab-1A
MLGDSGVGKTSLLDRFSQDKFTPSYITTIGVDIINKKLNIGNDIVNLKVWDTAGQERYQTLTKQFFQSVDGVVLVLNLLSLESFEKLEKWLELIRNKEQTLELIVAGNKCDCNEDERLVKLTDIETFVQEQQLEYLETSAKTGYNVEKLFKTLTKKILKRKGIKCELKDSIIIEQQQQKKKKKSTCC